MEQSILKSTKKMLDVGPDDTSFDLNIITDINSAFSILSDLGVGPENGFVIEDDEPVWADYLSGAPYDPTDPDHIIKLSKIKSCVWIRTKLLFDPPVTSFHLTSINNQLQEIEWRLNVDREAYAWTDPNSSEDEVEFAGFGLVGFGTGGFGL